MAEAQRPHPPFYSFHHGVDMHLARGITTGLILLTLGAGALDAQQGPPAGGGGRMIGPSVEELTKVLHLSAGQQTKSRVLIDKFLADTKGARETLMKNFQAMRDGSGDPNALREENMAAMFVVREGNDQLNKDIRAGLNADQQKAFDQWLAERRDRMRQMRQERQGPPPRG